MISIVLVTSVIAYAIVASQPLAYLVFLGQAQRALSARAYIELRQRINPVMSRRLPVIYLVTLGSLAILVALAMKTRSAPLLTAAAAALFCLIVDVVLMVRENVPINGVVDRWSASDFPEDWEDYRTRWLSAFAVRQAVLLVGFVALVIGTVLR